MQRLFQALQIGPRSTRNRILFGSHATNLASHNQPGAQHADYYAARAAGGAGIIVLEEHIVHASDQPYESALLGYKPETPQAIAPVVERIHAHSALALVQLNHNGQQSSSDYTQRELWAPSPVPNVASREVPKAMEIMDIQKVIAGFAQVARYAVAGGADGVELQVADSSLLRQFLSPLTNQRGDAYGGELANRLRFLQETIEAVDGAIGPENVLGLRLCADELAPWGGLTPEQGVEIACLLAETGRIDYFTITQGSIFSTQMFPFNASMQVAPGYAVHLAAAVKAAIAIPVFAAGRIMHADQAENILAEGQADGVEMIRALIADPRLPLLAQENKAKQIRPCLACNQGCQARNILNAPISCTVNPSVCTLETPKKIGTSAGEAIWIIGGGPAGMEAARTAALQGRHVVLYEQASGLGGAVALAARGPGRRDLRLIVDYLHDELIRLQVEIQTGVTVSEQMVLRHRPSAVVVATGAQPGPGLLPIPGHELPHVHHIRSVLNGETITGEHVLIIDETGSHGVASVAEMLATEGKQVEIVTQEWYAARDLAPTYDSTAWMQRVMAQGAIFTTHTNAVRIEPERVILSDCFAEGEIERAVDTVILGTYDLPEQSLYQALKGRVARLWRIGDCVTPRRIEQAIREGRQIGEQL